VKKFNQTFTRRKMLFSSAAMFYMTTVDRLAAAEVEQKNMTDEVPTYASSGIELKNFQRFWPKGKAVPQMIYDVAELIGPWPWGIVSHFYITASRPNDYGYENGADLWNEFGMFVGISNGTEYALWYYDGCPPGAEPVVSFGDEGDLRILAPNLKAFFTEWASGRGGGLDPFDYDATPALLAERKSYGDQILKLLQKYPDAPASRNVPDFEKFINDFANQAHAKNAADPTLKAISTLLAKYIPPKDSPHASRGKSFTLTAVGETVQTDTTLMEPDYKEMEPLPEREALIPLVLKARKEREAAQNDGRGPWVKGVLYLLPDGHAMISGDWE
jgi:hypothetical protein